MIKVSVLPNKISGIHYEKRSRQDLLNIFHSDEKTIQKLITAQNSR
jgi:hypothetical protein